MFEKVSRSLKVRFKYFFRPQTYIYIYMDTKVDLFTPLALRMQGNNMMLKPAIDVLLLVMMYLFGIIRQENTGYQESFARRLDQYRL